MPALRERVFSPADQEAFARLGGDRNPMHLDAVAARRTLAGAAVVHGIHALLWALDTWLAEVEPPPPIAGLRVSFARAIRVGDGVGLTARRHADGRAVIALEHDGLAALTATLVFGPGADPALDAGAPDSGPVLDPAEPLPLTLEQMTAMRGCLPCDPGLPEAAARRFPAVAAALGAERVAGLIRTSTLVGMVCPGLHSIFAGLALHVASPRGTAGGLAFRVTGTDERFRRVGLAVSGLGWRGGLDAYARPEPARPPEAEAIAARVAPDAFAGARVLVVGGSRGLGELTARIAARGGARVTLTYAVGAEDARRVQAEIAAAGGVCDGLRYDARVDPAGQLAAHLADPERVPDTLYYFATPPIARRRGETFRAADLAEFLDYYVTGFRALCLYLRARRGADLSIFQPSSVFVEARPPGLTAYAMAKASAEILCTDLQAGPERPGPILVRRLPRLPTDQNAALTAVETADPLDVMLPILHAVHAARPAP